MKILMITHGFPPECSGGTESYVLTLCRELRSLGHEIEVLCGSHEGAGPGAEEPKLVHGRHEGLRVHRLHRTGLFVDNWEKSLAPEIEPLVDFLLRDAAPDIVHLHHWIRLSRNLVEICHDRGIPVVCTLHDLWTTCPRAFRVRDNAFCEREPGPANCLGCAAAGEYMTDAEMRRELLLFRDDFRNELDLARRLIVPTVAHREVLLQHHPALQGKFRVVPHGNISPLRSRKAAGSSFPQGPLRIGHWGHLSTLKGFDLLLEAVQLCRDKANIELEVFGEIVRPEERARFDELSSGLTIHWHGAYKPLDLARVAMDLAIIPSRCSESWSFVLDEAFLLGLPVLVPDRGALKERLAGAGAAFLAESAKDLSRILADVFRNPGLLDAWRTRIPNLPQFRSHSESIERIYREVLSSTAPLPVTPRALRTRRLQVKAWQLEARNRRMEVTEGRVRKLQEDLRRAEATMKEMDFFHREKDKELVRLTAEAIQLRQALGGASPGAGSPRPEDAQPPAVDSEEARADLAEDAEAARKRLKALEKRDRKKQRRVERLRLQLLEELDQVRAARQALEQVLGQPDEGGAAPPAADAPAAPGVPPAPDSAPIAATATDVPAPEAIALRQQVLRALNQLQTARQENTSLRQERQVLGETLRLLRAETGTAEARMLGGEVARVKLREALDSLRELVDERTRAAQAAAEGLALLRGEVSGLQARLTDLLAEREQTKSWREYHLERVVSMRQALDVERTAVRVLRETLVREQARLADLARTRSRLDDRLRSLGHTLAGIVNRGPPATPAPVDPRPTVPTDLLPEEGSLLADIDRAEIELRRLLEQTAYCERLLEAGIAERDAALASMARTIDGLLETIAAQERRRRPPAGRPIPARGGRLKILMVVHQYLPGHVSGTEVYTRNLAIELARRHEVVILTAESDHSRPRFERSVRTFDGLKIHQVIHNYAWDGFRDVYDGPEVDDIFRAVLTEEQPDVVHFQHLHYWSVNFVTIARTRGIPTVYTLHDYMLLCPRDGQLRRADGELCEQPIPRKCADCIEHLPLTGPPTPPLPRALLPGAEALVPAEVTEIVRRALHSGEPFARPHEAAAAERLEYLRRVLRDVDLFLAPSEFLRRTFARAGMIPADRITVSDNGYEVGPFAAVSRVPAPGSLRVAYVGTIAEHKGLHVLIQAMNGIADERVSCRIWGDLTAFDAYASRLRQMIENPRTFLMGPFPPERIAEVLAQTDLLVVPSLWFENSPLTVHEAALAGIPVLASDQGGLAEYVVDGVTGLHFRLGDAADLGAKILRFLDAPGPLPGFNPRALPIKTIADDARDMEARYRRLIERVQALARS